MFIEVFGDQFPKERDFWVDFIKNVRNYCFIQ